jgi:hypothetical protein
MTTARLQLLGDLIDNLQEGERPHSDFDHVCAQFFTGRGQEIGWIAVARAGLTRERRLALRGISPRFRRSA